jgi:hypothetical protein
VLTYYAFGVVPATPLFDREKALNTQRCCMEHHRRGYPLRKDYFQILEESFWNSAGLECTAGLRVNGVSVLWLGFFLDILR